MRKIFFVVLCLCVWDTAVYAAPESECGDDNPNGCSEDNYCTVAGGADPKPYCQDCGMLKGEGNDHYAWPYSEKGGGLKEGTAVCYQDCNDTYSGYFPAPVEHGTWEAIDNRAYYSNKCQYKLQCDDPTDQCKGFHADYDTNPTGMCKSNQRLVFEGEGSCKKLLETYDPADGKWDKWGLVACDCEGVHFEPYGGDKIVCDQPLGECVPNTAWCAGRLGNCAGGTIGGKAYWIPDSRGWDYSDCRCTTTDAVVENGTGRKTCGWSEGEKDSTVWSSDCVVEVTECNGGHCVQGADRSKCVPAPFGYYAADNNLACQACPDAGTTTQIEGAASAGECGMVRGVGGTRFCDDEGCFYLPGTGFIQKAN